MSMLMARVEPRRSRGTHGVITFPLTCQGEIGVPSQHSELLAMYDVAQKLHDDLSQRNHQVVACESSRDKIIGEGEAWKESELAAMTRAGETMELQAQQYASCNVIAVKHDEAQAEGTQRHRCVLHGAEVEVVGVCLRVTW